MRDQGWDYDTAYGGLGVSGSIWRRKVDGGTLIGTVRAITIDGSIKLRMTVELI